jgi:hypothetical protein
MVTRKMYDIYVAFVMSLAYQLLSGGNDFIGDRLRLIPHRNVTAGAHQGFFSVAYWKSAPVPKKTVIRA